MYQHKNNPSKVSACCRCSLPSWLLVGMGLLAWCNCSNHYYFPGLLQVQQTAHRERSGSVVERLTRDRRDPGFEPHRRHCVVSLSKNINPSLVLVQPRKTCPFITERLLMGRKESNQTNKQQTAQMVGYCYNKYKC